MGIFSTYSQGENRITSTLLAVFQQLSLKQLDILLSALLDDDSFNTIQFKNQPNSSSNSVPDASISAGFNILVETKVKRNAVSKSQLASHVAEHGMPLSSVEKLPNDVARYIGNHKLVVLTPDYEKPSEIEQMGDDRVVWASFEHLNEAIEGILTNSAYVISEREQFLLREFQELMSQTGLLEPEKDTVIVPARDGISYELYKKTSVYACQANRSFRPAKYLGFYAHQAIQPIIARIIHIQDNVSLVANLHDGELGSAINKLLEANPKLEGLSQKIFLLSDFNSEDSIKLDDQVVNDLKSNKGKTVAFTQGQRYICSKNLVDSTKTSELFRKTG